MADPRMAISQQPDVVEGESFAKAAWGALEAMKEALGLPRLSIVAAGEFNQNIPLQPLLPEERDRMLAQARYLLEELYPHLPFKRPYSDTRLPEEWFEYARQAEFEPDFHNALLMAVSTLADSHTLFGLPEPYRDAVAFLPFETKVCWTVSGEPRYFVTRVMNTGDPAFATEFQPGVELLCWNDRDINSYTAAELGRLPSENYFTAITRGAAFAALRPLRYCALPDHAVARIEYWPVEGTESRTIAIPWGVATGMENQTRFSSTAYSLNEFHSVVRSTRRVILPNPVAATAAEPQPEQVTKIPAVFVVQYTGGAEIAGAPHPDRLRSRLRPEAKFGYIRIRSFEYAGLWGGIVSEFQRILREVMLEKAPDGLILDLRGNAGGLVMAAECLLQMISPVPITPMNFHLANTPTVRQLLATLKQLDELDVEPEKRKVLQELRADLRPWIDGLDQFQEQEPLSPGFSITDPQDANRIGRIYSGPCVLLADGLTYSSGEIFTAGFYDHGIGDVIGSGPFTGGGGANVWSHEHLSEYLTALPGIPDPTPLKNGATLSLAIRRAMRVHGAAGTAIEDTGVGVHLWFNAGSVDELLTGSQSVVEFACDHLVAPRKASLKAKDVRVEGRRIVLELESEGFDYGLVWVFGEKGEEHRAEAIALRSGERQAVSIPIPKGFSRPKWIELYGNYFYPEASSLNFLNYFADQYTFGG